MHKEREEGRVSLRSEKQNNEQLLQIGGAIQAANPPQNSPSPGATDTPDQRVPH